MIKTLLGLVANLIILAALLASTAVVLLTLAALALGPLGYSVAGIPVDTTSDVTTALIGIVSALLAAALIGKLNDQLNA